VAFTFLASATTAHLAASRISTRGDTVYAWTPARLTLPAHLEKVPIVVTTGQREPWLHAVVGLAQEVEAWGSEIHLIPGPGGLRLTANRVKWRASTSEAGRAVIGLMRK
jgi:hypothetical protein